MSIYRVSLLTKSSASSLYVLINTVVIDGTVVMLCKATCLLRRLNALDQEYIKDNIV